MKIRKKKTGRLVDVHDSSGKMSHEERVARLETVIAFYVGRPWWKRFLGIR